MVSVRDLSTPEARRMWETVDNVSRKLPEWMSEHIREVSRDYAEKLALRVQPTEQMAKRYKT